MHAIINNLESNIRWWYSYDHTTSPHTAGTFNGETLVACPKYIIQYIISKEEEITRFPSTEQV
jgi:hypothetical protein